MKTKEKRHSKFLERFWAHQDMRYSRLNKKSSKSTKTTTTSTTTSYDIQLQNLDAHSLLISKTDRNFAYRQDLPSATNSSPASSSLDLEWEHEYNNSQNHSWLMLPQEMTIDEMASENDCNTSTSASSSSSGTSTSSSSSSSSSKHSLRHNKKSMIKQNLSKKLTTIHHHRHHHQQASINNHNRVSPSKASWSHISTPDSLEWDVNDHDNELKTEEDFFDNETMELLQEIEWLKNRALNETGENLRDLLESES